MFPCTINAEASALFQFSAPLGIFRNSRSVPVHPAKLLAGGSVTAANWYKIDGMQKDGAFHILGIRTAHRGAAGG